MLVQAAILFLIAGRFNWMWAWVFLAICVVSMLINGSFMLRTSPETIAERGRPKATKSWDKVVGGLWALVLFLVVPVVAALDARLGLTRDLNVAWNIAGAVVLATGLGIAGWAMIANAFFSTAVRIQTERGHTVCRTGPYAVVRHPGYVGFGLQSIGTPLTLGSLWALIPGLTAVAIMVIRTMLEDRMLHAELPGYREFARNVRYRLVAGIW
jgi:protein-S-isoprenylcysteine O-methyltransferase Ste14